MTRNAPVAYSKQDAYASRKYCISCVGGITGSVPVSICKQDTSCSPAEVLHKLCGGVV